MGSTDWLYKLAITASCTGGWVAGWIAVLATGMDRDVS
jgi:hypothetical protein